MPPSEYLILQLFFRIHSIPVTQHDLRQSRSRQELLPNLPHLHQWAMSWQGIRILLSRCSPATGN